MFNLNKSQLSTIVMTQWFYELSWKLLQSVIVIVSISLNAIYYPFQIDGHFLFLAILKKTCPDNYGWMQCWNDQQLRK